MIYIQLFNNFFYSTDFERYFQDRILTKYGLTDENPSIKIGPFRFVN